MLEHNKKFVSYARGCIGTPFKHQGRQPKMGMDCIGLIVKSAEYAGMCIDDYTRYKRTPRPSELIPRLENHCFRISAEKILAGDLILFFFRKSWGPQHMGIVTNYIGDPKILGLIHTDASVIKVTEVPLAEPWLSRIHSYWRLKWPQ